MNLLIFVLSFLILLSSISYQGLAHFKTNANLRRVWDRYMRVEEPCAFNAVVREEHKRLNASDGKSLKKKDREAAQEKDDKDAKGASGINFRFLTDPEYPSTKPKQTELMEAVLKRLINLLYGDQPFFIAMAAKRPSILEELIPALRAASAEFNDNKGVSSKKNLNLVDLKDAELEAFWFQLKRKNPISLKTLELVTNVTPEEMKQLNDLPCYEVALIDYLSNSDVQKIRLYLASRPMLIALLGGDSAGAEALINKRKELYNEVKRKQSPMPASDAEAELKNFASQFQSLSAFEEILSYAVSKTNPSGYE